MKVTTLQLDITNESQEVNPFPEGDHKANNYVSWSTSGLGVGLAPLCASVCACPLWSPAGRGLTSSLSFVVSDCEFSLSRCCPWSGVVLDCVDSWSFHPYLFQAAQSEALTFISRICSVNVATPGVSFKRSILLNLTRNIKPYYVRR